MEERELVCIGCPMGCELRVKLQEGKVIEVKGNTCIRGEQYAKKECVNPTRVITSTVKVKNGNIGMVPVKTEKDVPKDKIMDIIKELKNLKVEAPLNIGDIILKNAAGTGVNVISTRKIKQI